jgi:hypothetical protein
MSFFLRDNEHRTINSRIPDCKLFIGIHGLTMNKSALCQGRSVLHVTSSGIRQSFPLTAEKGFESNRMFLRPSTITSNHRSMRIWEFSDYCGCHLVEIDLEQSRYLGFKKTMIARATIPLRALLEHMDKQFQSRESGTDALCVSYDVRLKIDEKWLSAYETLQPDAVLPVSTARETTSQGHRRAKFPGKEFMQLNNHFSSTSTVPQPSHVSANTSRMSSEYSAIDSSSSALADSTTEQPNITVTLKFRVIILQRCLQKQASTISLPHLSLLVNNLRHNSINSSTSGIYSPNNFTNHSCSEFHALAALAPSFLLVEVMKTLAWRGVLNRALALASSTGFYPLEYALLTSNSDNVIELLQRTGKLCFPRLLGHSSCVLHTAIAGNNHVGLDSICRFLKKYGPEFLVSDTGMPVNRHLSLSTLLEWRDEHDCTPLMLACLLPQRDHMVRILLLSGADTAAIQTATGHNALLCACIQGHSSTVEILLSLMNNIGDIGEFVDTPYHPPITTPAIAAGGTAGAGAVDAVNTGPHADYLDGAAPTAFAPGGAMVVLPPTGAATATAATGAPPRLHHHHHHHHHHQDALLRHVRQNARSRQILRGTSIAHGGFFNRLALFACQPAQRELPTQRTALHLALLGKHREIAFLLLDTGLSLLDVDIYQENGFHMLLHDSHSTVPSPSSSSFAVSYDLFKLFLPVEIKRWQQYQVELRPRAWELMMRQRIPFLQRNIRGEHVVDILFRQLAPPVSQSVPTDIAGEDVDKGLVLAYPDEARIATLRLVVQALMDHYVSSVSAVDALWIRALHRTVQLPWQMVFAPLSSSPSAASASLAPDSIVDVSTGTLIPLFLQAVREDTLQRLLAGQAQIDGSVLDYNSIEASAHSVYTSALTRHIPITIVALAVIQQLRRLVYARVAHAQETVDRSTDDTSTKSSAAVQESSTFMIGEVRDAFGRLLLASPAPTLFAKPNESINGSSSKETKENDDEAQRAERIAWEENNLADNADYLFALSALSLKAIQST